MLINVLAGLGIFFILLLLCLLIYHLSDVSFRMNCYIRNTARLQERLELLEERIFKLEKQKDKEYPF